MESRLGQQSYWDETFQQELASLEETEDYESSCEAWFGDSAQRKVDRLVLKHVPTSVHIVDLGCGNGCSLEAFGHKGYEHLIGVDYAEAAVRIAAQRVPQAKVFRGDLTVWRFQETGEGVSDGGVLIHDKGTLDAFLLHPDHTIQQYSAVLDSISAAFASAWFIVTSCNNTYEELLRLFPSFTEVDHVPDYPKFTFAGQQGSTLATVLFTVKAP